MSRMRGWPRFLDFESVAGGRSRSVGEDGEAGMLRVGERNNSRHATRGRVVSAGLLILFLILGIDIGELGGSTVG